MIKVEKIETFNWQGAIRGMRNPLNSWDKSDSQFDYDKMCLGENDLQLMKKLYKAGTEHRKYLRQIFVSMDITAPLYWIAELDTYKVGPTRNSCSFMHKGVSKPFEINDFTVDDERIYYLLNSLPKIKSNLYYPYETNEYREYKCENGRKYKIFKNGRIFRESFSYTDSKNRFREFEECEVFPSETKNGYFEINIGGRSREKWLVHRLVASVWLDNCNGFETVNHIDGNKSNNSVENLEWCSREENIKKGFAESLYEPNKLHLSYNSWKKSHKLSNPFLKFQIKREKESGISRSDLSKKYNIPVKTIDNMTSIKPCKNNDLFMQAYVWEKLIEQLNILRDLYLETNDFDYFRAIRQLLPQGYNVRFTYSMNYENVISMIKQRENHKLDEWNEFVKILKELPYIADIIK